MSRITMTLDRPQGVSTSRSMVAMTIATLMVATFLATNVRRAMAEESPPVDPVIAAVDAFIAENPVDKTRKKWKTRLTKPPIFKFDPAKKYVWKLETSVGDVKFRLLPDVAPMHVSSTIYLTRLGFYDNLRFHRVIQGFMAQGGDPLGRGTGGPGYKYDGEFRDDVVHDDIGMLSMANSGPGTDGSQFFITFRATPHLNKRHTIFGKAESVDSFKTIGKMEGLARPPGIGVTKPRQPIIIKKATIMIQ